MAQPRMLGEIFTEFLKKPTKSDRIDWLHENAGRPLFYLLQLALLPQAKWALPPGIPPYKPFAGKPGRAPSDLVRELRLMYMFLDGFEPGLRKFKREHMFATMLHELEQEEVDLIIAVKDKTFEKKYKCSKKLVDETFPGLLTSLYDGHYIRNRV